MSSNPPPRYALTCVVCGARFACSPKCDRVRNARRVAAKQAQPQAIITSQEDTPS